MCSKNRFELHLFLFLNDLHKYLLISLYFQHHALMLADEFVDKFLFYFDLFFRVSHFIKCQNISIAYSEKRDSNWELEIHSSILILRNHPLFLIKLWVFCSRQFASFLVTMLAFLYGCHPLQFAVWFSPQLLHFLMFEDSDSSIC